MASSPTGEELVQRIERSFARQAIMATLGAKLTKVERGTVEIELAFSDRLTQQAGFVHAGVIATIADSAGGYAALTLMEPDEDVMAVEFKLNLLKPAVGDRFLARAVVVRSGANISVCTADVFAIGSNDPVLVAVMMQTNFRIRPGALRVPTS